MELDSFFCGIWSHGPGFISSSVPLGSSYLAPGGGCEVLFSPGLSLSVSVCPANILVFYFSAIRRDIDLKFIQDTYRVVLNSLKNN